MLRSALLRHAALCFAPLGFAGLGFASDMIPASAGCSERRLTVRAAT